jgi:hypothetical protein
LNRHRVSSLGLNGIEAFGIAPQPLIVVRQCWLQTVDGIGGFLRFHSTRQRGSMNYDPVQSKKIAAPSHSRPTSPSSVQFSLSDLLCGIGICAVGITVLMYASQAWLMLIASVTLIAFLVELLVAIYQPGAPRAFAIGFVTWGLIYLGTVGLLLPDEYYSTNCVLPTSRILQFLYQQWHSSASANAIAKALPNLAASEREAFFRTGQLMWTWVFAICGGFLARELQRGNFDLRKLSQFRDSPPRR